MSRLYWLAVALFTAIAAHAGFVLMAPRYQFAQEAKRLVAPQGDNTFLVIPEAAQARLFPGFPRQGVVGVCLFDVSKSDVTLHANLPDGPWITTIYTLSGEAIYSVNDRQSGDNVFAVSLSLAPGIIEMLMQATDKERPEIDSGWTVMSPEPRGMAIVWHPLADAALRPTTVAAMSRTRCEAGPPRAGQ